MSASYIELENVVKQYKTGEVVVRAANGISFQVEKGELAIVTGPSGAGKTTVLNLLGGMDAVDGGIIRVDGVLISDFNIRQLTAYRRNQIGFVFQFYNLIQNLTALENVELASQICGHAMDAAEMLAQVGLKERMDHFPSQLSGGEQQRVAIARALAKAPKLLLCDEPTGALDDSTGKVILSLLQNTCRMAGMTMVIITHNQAIAPMADRIIHIRNGRVDDLHVNPNPTPVEEIEW
ncbi:MAG: ABC transporter ATP-binding protein [Bacillota bacterium]